MRRPETEAGFGLIEVMIGILLLSVGAFGLAAAVTISARQLTGSQDQILATQRAAEAAESVFKARDNRVLTWAQIRNVQGASGNDGGIFLDGPQSVRDPGPDGLANTADDGAIAEVIRPGLDGLLGTEDDEHKPLTGFTREVEIRPLGANLRQLRVIVRYPTSQGTRQYVLVTMLSAYA